MPTWRYGAPAWLANEDRALKTRSFSSPIFVARYSGCAGFETQRSHRKLKIEVAKI